MKARKVAAVLRRMVATGETEWPPACVWWARERMRTYGPPPWAYRRDLLSFLPDHDLVDSLIERASADGPWVDERGFYLPGVHRPASRIDRKRGADPRSCSR